MPGYGITRGNGYSSSGFEYNPLRGNCNNPNQNNDHYSSLHYKSNQSNYKQNHNHTHTQNHNPTNPSSLHSGSASNTNNLPSNPYSALNNNTTHILPDLTIPRRQPQLITTPQRPKLIKKATHNHHKTHVHTTNGWNLNAFGFIKSAWSKLIGTPSKKHNTKPHRSMSQPPQPIHNPYAHTPTKPLPPPPVTPPQQTRPPIVNIIKSEQKNNNNTTKPPSSKNDGSAVISIHNLLQKTKLSPDDAAWLHSKIDAVTHDKYDGSLSYIGPIPQRSQSLVQHLNFDDSATENSSNTNNIYSPLRSTNTSHSHGHVHSIIPASIPSSRYMPHPGGFHKPKVFETRHRGVIRRKRPRRDVFDGDENGDTQSQGSRKRARLTSAKSAYAPRRGGGVHGVFKDNYLRPINSLHSTYKIVPKYDEINNKLVEKDKEIEKKKEIENKKFKVDNDKKVCGNGEGKNGFCFGENNTNTNTNNTQVLSFIDSVVDGDNDVLNDKSDTLNGFGSHTQSEEALSEEISENNVVMSNGKVKGKIKSRSRTPLGDKKIDNSNNKIQRINSDEDNDDKMKDKMNDEDDEDEDLKKEIKCKSPKSKSPIAKTKNKSPNKPLTRKNKNKNGKTPMDVSEKEVKIKTPPKIINASPSPKIVHVTLPITCNDKKDENENNEEKKSDKKQKKKGNYLAQVMRERKERYIALYKKRLGRIYKVYQPTKLDRVNAFVDKYGFDVDKLHDLYKKICNKYALQACDKYEGSKHEAEPNEDECETAINNIKKKVETPRRFEKTPPKRQTLRHNLNDEEVFKFKNDNDGNIAEKKEEKKKEKVEENGWGFGSFGNNNKKKDVIKPTFDNAKSPFDTKDDKAKTESNGWSFGGNNNNNKSFSWDNKNDNNGKNDKNKNNNKIKLIKPTVMDTDTNNNKNMINTPTNNGWKPRINDVSGSTNKANDNNKNKNKNKTELFTQSPMNFQIPTGFTFNNDKKDGKSDVKINDNAVVTTTTRPTANGNWNNGFKFGGSSENNNKVVLPPATPTNTVSVDNNNNNKSFSWDNKNNNNAKKTDNKQNNSNGFSVATWGNKNNDNKQNNSFSNPNPNPSFSNNNKANDTNNNNNNGFPWNNNTNKNDTTMNNKQNNNIFGNQSFSNNNKQNKSFSWDNKANNNPFANSFNTPNNNNNNNKNNNNNNWGSNNNNNNNNSNQSAFGNNKPTGNKNVFSSGGNNNWGAGNGNGNANSAFSMNNNANNPANNSANNSGNSGGWSNNNNPNNPNNTFNNSGGNNSNGGFTFQRTDGNLSNMNMNKNKNNGSGFFTSNKPKKRPIFKATRRLKK